MKHIFVINPHAGKADSSQEITQMLESHFKHIDYGTYVTRFPGDGTDFVKQWCHAHPGEDVRFYACGGDGTINEVVTGMMDYKYSFTDGVMSVRQSLPEHFELSCYPCGSGNDYIKYYGHRDEFLDATRLIDGISHPVDVMRVNNRFSINVSNFGFDAAVCEQMIKIKRKPIIGGNNAYTTGIITSIFTHMKNHCRMKVDGEPFYDGDFLLSTVSNGQYVGGAYKCAPLSKNDDGLLEVNLFKTMSLLKLATMIGDYAKGTHINIPGIEKWMRYTQGKIVEIENDEPFTLIIDGDVLHERYYRIENIQHALNFISPSK